MGVPPGKLGKRDSSILSETLFMINVTRIHR